MKITTKKLKVTPLIFNKNYENNESKIVFSTKAGGGSSPFGNFHKKMFFDPSLSHQGQKSGILTIFVHILAHGDQNMKLRKK